MFYKQIDTLRVKYGITYCKYYNGFELVLALPVVPFIGRKVIFYFSNLAKSSNTTFPSWTTGWHINRKNLFDIVTV